MIEIKTISRKKRPYGLDARVLIFQKGKLVAYVTADIVRELFTHRVDDKIEFTIKYLNKKNKKRS